MANIDYQEAKKEIEKIFRKESPTRKIVFWYDAPANFKDDVESDNFDFCRVLVCQNNEFSIKKVIEKDDLTSNILVYVPSEKPCNNENWLLDILLYSDEEYYADTIALTMRRLGLSNSNLRKVVEKHIKFFDSAQRIKKLSNCVNVNDDMIEENFKLAMMASIVKTPESLRSIDAILMELVYDDTKTKYKDICKFGFEDFLWDEIAREYNYDGNQDIEILIKKFLFTAMIGQDIQLGDIPSFYEQYIIDGEGRNGARRFVHYIKQDKGRYRDLQSRVACDLRIEGLLVSKDIICAGVSDVFECIDTYIIKKMAESLVGGSIDYDTFIKVLNNRNNSLWYDNYKYEYATLRSAIEFLQITSKPISHDLTAVDYIKLYVDSYYMIDTYYRHFCTNYKLIKNPIEEIDKLSKQLENRYEQDYLNVLGNEYSKAISDVNDWDFVGIQKSSSFYQLIQRDQHKKLFVIISDGLRYEIGHEVYENIKNDTGLRGKVTIDYALSPLPSETRFGMASLLPHKNISYSECAVWIDGQRTNSIDAREAILKAKNQKYSAISYEKINGFSQDDLRNYMSDRSLVYIFHNVIDKTGENDEANVFSKTDDAIRQLSTLVRKLYNNLQISNFYITADHGFIYRQNDISESQKYSDVVSQNPLEASKRYVLTDELNMDIPYTISFSLNEYMMNLRVITPYGYDLFKTRGGGIKYIHGGHSLQEVVIPIIHISELNAKKGAKLARPVGVRLKSINRKITNRSFSLDFEQYEKVGDKLHERNCETFLVDEKGDKVSGEYRFIANSNSDDISTRVTRIRFTLRNIEFERNRAYYLILKDVDIDNEYIEREQFIIDILGFKII